MIGYVIYPSTLTWISKHAPDTESMTSALRNIHQIFQRAPSPHFASHIVRAMAAVVEVSPKLRDQATDVLHGIAEFLDPEFVLYISSVQQVCNVSADKQFSDLVETFREMRPPSPKKKHYDEICRVELCCCQLVRHFVFAFRLVLGMTMNGASGGTTV
jgi:hypothetical protein